MAAPGLFQHPPGTVDTHRPDPAGGKRRDRLSGAAAHVERQFPAARCEQLEETTVEDLEEGISGQPIPPRDQPAGIGAIVHPGPAGRRHGSGLRRHGSDLRRPQPHPGVEGPAPGPGFVDSHRVQV